MKFLLRIWENTKKDLLKLSFLPILFGVPYAIYHHLTSKPDEYQNRSVVGNTFNGPTNLFTGDIRVENDQRHIASVSNIFYETLDTNGFQKQSTTTITVAGYDPEMSNLAVEIMTSLKSHGYTVSGINTALGMMEGGHPISGVKIIPNPQEVIIGSKI